MLVVDASLVVAALVDTGKAGTWAHGLLGADRLAAPHLMPVEAANILRRAVLNGVLSTDSAALAHADLLALRIEPFRTPPSPTGSGSCAGTSPVTTPGTLP